MYMSLLCLFLLPTVVLSDPLPLVPYPQSVSQTPGLYAVINPPTFRFHSNVRSVVLEEAFVRYHRYLNLHDYQQTLNTTLDVLELVISDKSEELILETSENYTLSVTENKATVTADTIFAGMRALETFSQLVHTNNYTVPAVEIVDFPRYKFRGFMLDTSRHYLSISVIKQLIAAASWTKLNIFHWHIVDDPSFPYTSITYPEMSAKGAYSPDHVYSQTDVYDILLFAYRHGVIVVPEFDTPGHTLSWGKTFPGFLSHCPGHGLIGSDYGPIDPTNEAVYPILKNIFTEIAQVFPSDFIHLGGDEVHYGCWKADDSINKWMDAHNMSGNYEKLEDYYETRLIQIVDTLNKNYIVWEEIFNHHLDIKPKTIIHAWLPNWKHVFQNATVKGYRCILSACWYLNRIHYGDDWTKFYQCDPRSFNATATYEQQQLVLGGTICMWGEYVDNTNALSRTWPRASAPAERLWSAKEIKNVSFMEPRINAHRCRMVYRGYPAEPSNSRGFCPVEYSFPHRRHETNVDI